MIWDHHQWLDLDETIPFYYPYILFGHRMCFWHGGHILVYLEKSTWPVDFDFLFFLSRVFSLWPLVFFSPSIKTRNSSSLCLFDSHVNLSLAWLAVHFFPLPICIYCSCWETRGGEKGRKGKEGLQQPRLLNGQGKMIFDLIHFDLYEIWGL